MHSFQTTPVVIVLLLQVHFSMQQVIVGFDTTEMIKEMELPGPSQIDFGIEEIEDEDSDDDDDDEGEENEDYDDVFISSLPFSFEFSACMNLAVQGCGIFLYNILLGMG